MPLIDSDHVVEQVAPAALHPALGNSILPGASIGGWHTLKFVTTFLT